MPEQTRTSRTARPTLQAIATGGAQGPRATYPAPRGYPNTVLPEEAGRLDLVLEQPLYHAGGKAARSRFDAHTALVNLDYRKELTAIAATVQRRFLDLYRAETGVSIATEGVDAAGKYRDLVQRLVASGSAKPVMNLQTAESQLAEARSGLTQAEMGEKLAKLAINQVLGRAINTPLNVPIVQPNTVTLPVNSDAGIEQALKNRTEVVELHLEIAAAKAGITLARSQSQPSLVARGQVTEQTPSAFVHEHYASAMLEIRLPILDNGRTNLDAREAEAQTKRLEALLEQANSGVSADVVRAFTRIQDAVSRERTTQAQITSVTATEGVTETAYSVGRATVFEVQAAYREVRLAKDKHANSVVDLLSAIDEFVQAQGIVPAYIDTIAPLPAIPEHKR